MEKCELCGESECKIKEHKHKPIRVKFCPQCKATDVKFVFELKNLFGLVPRMTCLKCGTHAPDFPIVVVPVKKKKSTKKTKKKARKKK